MEYIAHINSEETQSVHEHCENTAKMAARFSADFGAKNIGILLGLLHDGGKLTERFRKYILGNSHDKRGDIDHSFAGAKYICELADEADRKKFYGVSRLIARAIISHHGLHDWIDENCEDYFKKRVCKDEDYEQIRRNIDEILDVIGCFYCWKRRNGNTLSSEKKYVHFRRAVLRKAKSLHFIMECWNE